MFVVIGLTGARWWQNHKAQQEEIATMADQSSAQLSQNNEGQSVPLTDGNADAGTNVPLTDNSAAPADAGAAAQAPAATAQVPGTAQQQPAVVSPSQTTLPETTPAVQAPLPTADAGVAAPAADPNALVMDFSADCWLQVSDASGKTLFSGTQKKGGKLNTAGFRAV